MIFPLLHQSSAVPADLRVFPPVSGRKFPYGEIFCRKNAPNARVTDGKIDSEGENCDRRSACATRKRTVREPPFHAVPRHETVFLSGCGEGSPAPSALHMRVVLPISTSAGIACPFLEKNGLPQRVAWHRLFRIWRNIPEKRVEDGLLFGCITTKLYFCRK